MEFTDPALKSCLEKALKKSKLDSFKQLKSLTCHNAGIQSIKGVSQLASLTSLSLFGNQLTELDDKLPSTLVTLNVSKNRLSQLTISRLPKLEKLYVFKNALTHLVLTNLPALVQFKANDNHLEQITLSQLPKLKKVYLFNNQLTVMPIDLPAMRYLDVRHNPMPDEFYDELDALSGVTALHDGNADDW